MSQSHKGVDCLKLLCAVGRGLKVASVTLAWRKPRALVDLPPFPSRSAICDSDAKISRRHTDRYTMYGERGLRSASDCVLHMAAAIGWCGKIANKNMPFDERVRPHRYIRSASNERSAKVHMYKIVVSTDVRFMRAYHWNTSSLSP